MVGVAIRPVFFSLTFAPSFHYLHIIRRQAQSVLAQKRVFHAGEAS
jgi:hypothetical protein